MRILILLFLLVPTFVAAETYSWEDESGFHFTDDPSNVPLHVRKKVRQELPTEPDSNKQKKNPPVQRETKRTGNTRTEKTSDDWSRYVQFTPPPEYVASDEPGNCGISRTGITYSKPSSSNSDDGWITMAFMDGRLADPAIARRAGLPTLTIDSLMDYTYKEFNNSKEIKTSIKMGFLVGRPAVVVTSKKEERHASRSGSQSMKRYQTLCGIRIFEVRILAGNDAKVQELDEYVQQMSLTPDCCNYKGE